MPQRAGEYRHRLIIQKRTETRDAAGQPARAYTEFAIRWGKPGKHTGGESHPEGARRSSQTVEWRMHQTRGISPKMRVLAPMAVTTLATAVAGAADTSFTVADAGDWPLEGKYRARVASEIVEVTAGQGTTSWTVSRGLDGTTAATAYAAGTAIHHMEPYDILTAYNDWDAGAETVLSARRTDGGS